MDNQPRTTPKAHRDSSETSLESLYQTGLEHTSTFDLHQLLHSIVRSLTKILRADLITLYLYDQVKGDFYPPAIASGTYTGIEENDLPDKGGCAARIALGGEAVIAHQAQEHPLMAQGFIQKHHIASSAGFPLKIAGNTVGVLFVNFFDPHQFSTEDIERVTIFASQAAIVIRNAELLRQQEAANKRLEVLQQAQKAIDSATDLQEVLTQILSEGLKTVKTGRGSLMLIEGENLVIKAQAGPEAGDPDRTTMAFKLGEGIAGIVAKTGDARICPEVSLEPDFKSPEGKDIRFHSLLAVPIISRESKQVIGVISADDPRPNYFDETHKQLLSDMAVQFATAIEKMMLVDTLHSLHKIFEQITSVAIVGRELPLVLDEIARNAIEVLKIDVITIYEYDQDHEKFLVPPLMRGISQNQRMQMQTEVFEGEAPWLLVRQLKRNHYAADAPADPIMSPPRPAWKGAGFVSREGIRSSAGVLLKVGEVIVGVMFVNYRSPHAFLARETQTIETFANSAAIAIQDVRQWNNLKRTQEQLIQTAKMSAVGTLASGVAHELKNPLANILSSINLIETGRIPRPMTEEKLQEIKSEVHRARKIIDSLLNFVRPRESIREAVDVVTLINESLNILENQARLNHVTIEPRLSAVPLLQGNATALRQVFINILINAIEAMPDGGRLTIETQADNSNVRIEIQDTGPGIAADQIGRIFEPFFTTKEAGDGTGLGLALSYEIVHDHHGDITAVSVAGQGATFVVTLPIGDRNYESADR